VADVRQAAEQHRFEIWQDGSRAGVATYKDADGARTFLHTEIEPAFGGRGLASELIRVALAETRASGLDVVPVCPFVKAYLAKEAGGDEQ
jgi:predicted GNAT family acetyltransferase